jgi:hypothetical protein
MVNRFDTKVDLTSYLSQTDSARLQLIGAASSGEVELDADKQFLLELIKESLVAFALLDATTKELEMLPDLPGYARLLEHQEFDAIGSILTTAVVGNREALENFKTRSARHVSQEDEAKDVDSR